MLATVAAGCLIAACGSASSSSSSASASATTPTSSAAAGGSGSGSAGGAGGFSARRAQLVSCLKAHGVTLPSRPAGSRPPGSGTGTTGTGTTTGPRRGFFFGGGTSNPKTLAALKACGANFGGGRGFTGRLSHTRIDNFVACVRKNGYDLPAPNFSGKGPIFPANIQSNPQFKAASRKCQSLLIPPRGAQPSGGGSSTSAGA